MAVLPILSEMLPDASLPAVLQRAMTDTVKAAVSRENDIILWDICEAWEMIIRPPNAPQAIADSNKPFIPLFRKVSWRIRCLYPK